jgi:hypothetical protein
VKAQRLFPVAVFIIFAAALAFWLTGKDGPLHRNQPAAESAATPPPATTGFPATVHSQSGAPSSPNATPSTPTALDPAAAPVNAAPANAARPTSDRLRADIEDVQLVLRDFRTGLGENPVGNNAEITKALLGNNLKQLKLEVPVGSQLNADGELCDRFGTPYFFHQLSGTKMEIRSAGPDRQMWTADDVQK